MPDQPEQRIYAASAAALSRLVGVLVDESRAADLADQMTRLERDLWAAVLDHTIEPWAPPAAPAAAGEEGTSSC